MTQQTRRADGYGGGGSAGVSQATFDTYTNTTAPAAYQKIIKVATMFRATDQTGYRDDAVLRCRGIGTGIDEAAQHGGFAGLSRDCRCNNTSRPARAC